MPSPGVTTQPVKLAGLALGLNNEDRPTNLPLGAATVADNVSLRRGTLKSMPGYKRVTNTLPREPAILFNGRDHMLQSELLDTGSRFHPTGSNYTIEAIFSTSAIKDVQTVLYKGRGGAVGVGGVASTTDWQLIVFSTAGALAVAWQLSNGVSFTTIAHTAVTTAGSAIIRPNTAYLAALTYDGSNWRGYLFEPGQDSGTPTTVATVASTPSDTQYSSFYVGGQPIAAASIVRYDQVSQLHFQGVIQEIRFWTSTRTGTELTNNASSQVAGTATQIGYKLTGGSGIEFDDDTGHGDTLYMEPTRARWMSQGLVDSSGKALRFDGINDIVVIPDAYRYRQVVPNSDGEYPAYEDWWVSLSINMDALFTNSTILHCTHVRKSSQWTNFVSPALMNGSVSLAGGQRAQWALELAEDTTDAGEYEFRFIVWVDNNGTVECYCVSTDLSTGAGGGVQVGTTYQVLLTYTHNSGNPIIKIWLNGSNSGLSPDALTITASGSPDVVILNTDDDPVGSSAKYLLVMGGCIRESRKGDNNHADPNDIEWEPQGQRYFRGQIDQLIIGSGSPSASATSIYLGNLLEDTYLDRLAIASLDAKVLSCWLMNEGEGDVLEDIGQQGNTITFQSDPRYLRANSRIATTNNGRVYGIVDQEYRMPTGPVRRVLAVHGGGIAEVDEQNATLTHLFDGLRNDDGNRVSLDRWRDSVIVCSGQDPNMMIWRDQLYRLSIEPPIGFIPFGVADQIEPEAAALRPGRYVYAFTFWSQFQAKRSPVGTQIVLELRWDANVVFGEDAEMLQTHAESIFSLKSPFDLTDPTGKKAWLRIQAWLNTDEAGPGSGDPGNAHVKFTDKSGLKTHWIQEKDSVTAQEVKNAVEARAKRCWVETYSDDSLKIKSRFLGSKARLQIQNASGSPVCDTVDQIFNASDPMTTAGSEIVDGTGVSGHGLKLPTTDDPQVTHLEIWRSLADGNDLRLVGRIPIGTASFKDTLPDEQNTGEILDVDVGPVPPCKYVVPFGSRRLYFGDPFQPQRLYVSESNAPWAVRHGNVIEVTDGRKLALTMAIGSEDNVILCKRDSTLVAVPTTNPALPLQLFTRFRRRGADAPFGAVEVDGLAMWPEEDTIQAYDGGRPTDLSEVLGDAFDDLDRSARSKIAACYYKSEGAVGWSCASGDTLVNAAKVNDLILWWQEGVGRGPDGKLYGWTRQTAINAELWALVEDDDGRDRLWFVDSFGYIHEYGVGNYAGNWDGSSVLTAATLTASAGGASSVTVPQATLANVPDGHKGFWITLVRAADASRETRLVTADTLASPSVLTVDHAWDGAAPVSGDQVLVGFIPVHYESGDMTLAGHEAMAKLLRIHATMRPQASGSFELGWKAHRGLVSEPTDFSTATVDATADNLQKGVADNTYGKRHRVRVRATTPGVPFEIEELSLEASATGTGQYEGTTT